MKSKSDKNLIVVSIFSKVLLLSLSIEEYWVNVSLTRKAISRSLCSLFRYFLNCSFRGGLQRFFASLEKSVANSFSFLHTLTISEPICSNISDTSLYQTLQGQACP